MDPAGGRIAPAGLYASDAGEQVRRQAAACLCLPNGLATKQASFGWLGQAREGCGCTGLQPEGSRSKQFKNWLATAAGRGVSYQVGNGAGTPVDAGHHPGLECGRSTGAARGRPDSNLGLNRGCDQAARDLEAVSCLRRSTVMAAGLKRRLLAEWRRPFGRQQQYPSHRRQTDADDVERWLRLPLELEQAGLLHPD